MVLKALKENVWVKLVNKVTNWYCGGYFLVVPSSVEVAGRSQSTAFFF